MRCEQVWGLAVAERGLANDLGHLRGKGEVGEQRCVCVHACVCVCVCVCVRARRCARACVRWELVLVADPSFLKAAHLSQDGGWQLHAPGVAPVAVLGGPGIGELVQVGLDLGHDRGVLGRAVKKGQRERGSGAGKIEEGTSLRALRCCIRLAQNLSFPGTSLAHIHMHQHAFPSDLPLISSLHTPPSHLQ